MNEEFFSSWQNRTNNYKSSFDASGEEEALQSMFDGRNLYVDVEVSFAEVMQEGGVTKEVTVTRDSHCKTCNGTRERPGSQSLPCYSCKGEGVKKDALFGKETKCNTCKGHGKLVQNECQACHGQGLTKQ